MANNVLIPSSASGNTIATDEVSGSAHIQLVKLVNGTENSEARIPGDSTNGLYVNVKDIKADAQVVGTLDKIQCSGGLQTVKCGTFSIASGTTGTLVSGVTSKKIRLLSLGLSTDTSATMKLKSGGTDKLVNVYLNSGVVHQLAPQHGWIMETDASGALNIEFSTAVTAGGWFTYIEV